MDESGLGELEELFQDLYEFSRPNINPYLSENDEAIHFCGQKTYPQFLEQKLRVGTYYEVDWTETELESISTFVKLNVVVTNKMINEIGELGGLWPMLLEYESYEKDFSGAGLKSWVPLEAEIPGISKKIEDFIDSKFLDAIKYKEDEEGARVYQSIANNLERLREKRNWDVDDELLSNLRAYQRPEISRREVSQNVYLEILREIMKSQGNCKHFDERLCDSCESHFYPQTNPFVPFVGLNFCSTCYFVASGLKDSYDKYMKSLKKVSEKREFAINTLRAFVSATGILPNADYKPDRMLRKSLLKNLEPSEATILLKAICIAPRPSAIKKTIFPSWAHLLDAAGLLEGNFNPKSRGRRSISSCGHLCLSVGERAICELLFRRRIAHSREPLYPAHEVHNPNGKSRADFLVGNLWIEFAGLKGQSDYDDRMAKKVALATELKLDLLVIEPSHLGSLDEFMDLNLRK
jgi:hypothetical protein